MSVKTPFYYYDLTLLENTLEAMSSAINNPNFKVHYAIKANAEDRILQTIKNHGLGADCVSGNEIKKAIALGFNPENIVFAGIGKSDEELDIAISNGIHSINCESIEELVVINEIAEKHDAIANIAFRINPNVDAQTHHKITTGLNENKFGIPITELDAAVDEILKHKHLALKGVHFHIGSQILNLNPFANLCQQANNVIANLKARGIALEHINVGGGLGINYNNPDSQLIPNFEEYFKVFEKFLNLDEGQTVHFELGRSIVGQCGSLISKVLYVKKGANSKFAIIDAGMTDLIRPALYNAYHKVENLSQTGDELEPYHVVGPICESSDTFGKTELPTTTRGDYMMIRSAGAYGQVLSSNYNLRERAATIYSDEQSLASCIGSEKKAQTLEVV
ncbi:diaminopimelate decarboxylase [Reichenbachiella carrageenanivorans]|uniref:Diaminopimelate decarboxylase n=1 Tax=Reichenbachiella carrageenanivorans TaxID=2979869 RepID=A0ABY6D205_9BACT|nr:diaminopimelate decarboxylase [Reichenbachiella carrageenanivorans]UXX79944.1 diaminopimelate decarboxylase [Reichenbachiella carrageenanivorans]